MAERTIRFDETGSNQFMNSFANNMASTNARQMFSPAPRLGDGSALPSLDQGVLDVTIYSRKWHILALLLSSVGLTGI